MEEKEGAEVALARRLLGDPVVHLFSHQRHAMFVLHAPVPTVPPAPPPAAAPTSTPTTSDTAAAALRRPAPLRPARWLDAAGLAGVGLTTGMRKALDRATRPDAKRPKAQPKAQKPQAQPKAQKPQAQPKAQKPQAQPKPQTKTKGQARK